MSRHQIPWSISLLHILCPNFHAVSAGVCSASCSLTPTQSSGIPSLLTQLGAATLPSLQAAYDSLVESSYGWHTGNSLWMKKLWQPWPFIQCVWCCLVPACEYGFSYNPNLQRRLHHDKQSRQSPRQMPSAWTGLILWKHSFDCILWKHYPAIWCSITGVLCLTWPHSGQQRFMSRSVWCQKWYESWGNR